MSTNSRRDFLKTASATAAAMAVTNNVAAWGAQGSQAPPVSPVKVWSTYRDKRHAAGEPLQWKQASQIAARLPVALFLLLGCLLIYALLRKVAASIPAALLGVGLFLACPLVMRSCVSP